MHIGLLVQYALFTTLFSTHSSDVVDFVIISKMAAILNVQNYVMLSSSKSTWDFWFIIRCQDKI
jgi:hypothetical protein